MKFLRYSLLACLFINTINIHAMQNNYSTKKPINITTLLNDIEKRKNRDVKYECASAINSKISELLSNDQTTISTGIDTILNRLEIADKTIEYNISCHPHYHRITGNVKTVIKTAAFINFYGSIESDNDDKPTSSMIGYYPASLLHFCAKHLEKINDYHLRLSKDKITDLANSLKNTPTTCTPEAITPILVETIKKIAALDYSNDLNQIHFIDQTIMYEHCRKAKDQTLSEEFLKSLNYKKTWGEGPCYKGDTVCYQLLTNEKPQYRY